MKEDEYVEKMSEFVRTVLTDALSEEHVDLMSTADSVEKYFVRAFTHRSFGRARDTLDYEIPETIGTKMLSLFFSSWLATVLSDVHNDPETFRILENYFIGNKFIGQLMSEMGFDEMILLEKRVGLDAFIRRDVFSAFIYQLSVAADQLIQDGLGIIFARQFVYWIYDNYAREDLEDLSDISKYISPYDKLLDVFKFNGWVGSLVFIEKPSVKYPDGSILEAAVDIKVQKGNTVSAEDIPEGVKIQSIPDRIDGKVIGTGIGRDIEDARNNASKSALSFLRINFEQTREIDVDFSSLHSAKYQRYLEQFPKQIQDIREILASKRKTFTDLQIRSIVVLDQTRVVIRAKQRGAWIDVARGFGQTKDMAILNAMNNFIRVHQKKSRRKD